MAHLELTHPRPDVTVITLNRPEKLNALNYGLVEDLHGALDLILTARTVDADEALRIGLVSRLSENSVVDDALAIAETLCGYSRFGLESTKQVLWANLEASGIEAALHVENRSQILASTSGELREAAAVFAARKDG